MGDFPSQQRENPASTRALADTASARHRMKRAFRSVFRLYAPKSNLARAQPKSAISSFNSGIPRTTNANRIRFWVAGVGLF
jgi:RNase P protein component